jgi:hypothetical protein
VKITRRTDSELRAEHRPRFIPVLIAALLVGIVVEELIRHPASGLDFGAALLGIGVGVALFFLALRGSSIDLDAPAGTATLRTVGLFSPPPTVLRLEEIRDITLGTGEDRSRSRIVFLVGDGPLGTTWHALRASRDREAVEAVRAWMDARGFELAPRVGKLRVRDRIRLDAPPGQTRDWLPPGEALEGRVERFLPPTRRGSLERAVVRLDRTRTVGSVEANWLLLIQRFDPPRWFEAGEVYVVASPSEPRGWTVGIDRTARAMEGTGVYAAVRDAS